MNIFVTYLLPIFYALGFAWLLSRSRVALAAGLQPRFLQAVVLAKCAAGIVYIVVSVKFMPNGGDLTLFFDDGLALYKLLWQNPKACFDAILSLLSISDLAVADTNSDYVRTAFGAIKVVHFLLNLLSGGNNYTNTIIFNGLFVWALLGCWAFMRRHLHSRVLPLILFLFPSAFFHTAGIHKEGFVMLLLYLLLPVLNKLIVDRRWVSLPLVLACIGLMLVLKVFVGLVFLAAVLLWMMLHHYKLRRGLLVVSYMLLCILVFFCAKYAAPALDFPQYFVQRQQEFMLLEASSAIPMPPLDPNFWSFAKAFPSAISHALFKPFPGEGGKLMYWAFSLEMLAFWAITLTLALLGGGKLKPLKPLQWALLFFALINLVIIGYTIPNIGAIVRYRSIFVPWLALGLWGMLARKAVFVNAQQLILQHIYLPETKQRF